MWRAFSQVSHDAGDKRVPQRGLNPPGVAGTDSSQAMLVLCRAAPLPSFGAVCWWHFLMPIKHCPSPYPRRPTSRPRAIFLPLLRFQPPRVPMFHGWGLLEGVTSLALMETPFP